MHFGYNGRFILSVTDYKENIEKEIDRVKALKKFTIGIWILDSIRVEGLLYCNDKAMKITRLV